MGLVDGNGGQVVNQLLGVGITIAVAIIGSYILLKIVDVVIGVRVREEEEILGLDLSLHGEDGYALDFELDLPEPSLAEAPTM